MLAPPPACFLYRTDYSSNIEARSPLWYDPPMTNRWRRFTYTLWAPGYDAVGWLFRRKRARALQLLALQPHERVLLVGAGTGLDLPLLPRDLRLTAIDLTPAMIRRLTRRAARLQISLDARAMDAQQLAFPDASFDAVILHLILAVVPDPVPCIREVARVLRPGGRAVVLDKFVPDGTKPSLLRRLFNPLALAFFTDMTRKLGSIAAADPSLRITHDEPAGWGGFFRIALLQKQSPQAHRESPAIGPAPH
jgi:phosphatidylethanolamine/phosphatidyl-N-methylethanolamine N-methyltransferase